MSSGEVEGILARSLRVSLPRAEAAWNEVLAAIVVALKGDRSVTLLNICTLEPYTMAASNYRHPREGNLVAVPARKYVRLMVARSLKESLRAEG